MEFFHMIEESLRNDLGTKIFAMLATISAAGTYVTYLMTKDKYLVSAGVAATIFFLVLIILKAIGFDK